MAVAIVILMAIATLLLLLGLFLSWWNYPDDRPDDDRGPQWR